MLLAGAARPHVAFLGRIHNEAVPGVVIFRAESSLLYFNAEHVRQVVWDKLQATPGLRLVVCDLSDAPVVDLAGADMLAGLPRDLTRREVRLRVVEAHAKVRDMLRRGTGRGVGYVGRHITVDQVIVESQAAVTP